MSSRINKQEEYILSRAKFEELKEQGKLIVGSIYHITDDASTQDLIDGIYTVKKAERDASGNVITSTYRTVADSYTKAQVDALIPSKTSDLTNDGDGTDNNSPYATQQYVDQNGGKIDKIEVNGVEQEIVNKTVNITVPTQTSDLTNNGDGTDNNSPFATQKYVQDNGGKIDTIKVNGVTQTITNKAVDITVPTATSDLINDSGFIDNTVNDLTNYTDTTTLNNTLNKVVQSNTGVTVSGDNVSLSKSFVNVGTGATSSDTTAIPLATDETGGLMSSSDYAQIRDNTQRIENLEGKTTRLLYPYTINAADITISDTTTLQIGSILKEGSIVNGSTLLEDTTLTVATSLITDDKIATGSTIINGSIVNGVSYPTATQINAFVVALGYTSPFEGIAVVTNTTYHIWHYYENNGIGWKDDGVDTVTEFTNSTPGTILGSATDGKVYAETDGTGSVYGWDSLKNRVLDVEQNKASLTDLATKQDILVSGTNIKTINNESVLGSGNIDAGLPILSGTSDPTTSTVGELGQIYIRTDKGSIWQCVQTGSSYKWVNIGGDKNGYSAGGGTAGASTSIGIAGSAGTANSIAIGYQSSIGAFSSSGIAVGYNAQIGNLSSGAIQIGSGTNSTANTLQIVNDNIYNHNSHTMTVQNITQNNNPVYGVLSGTTAPTTSTVGSVGQFYIDTATTMLYKCDEVVTVGNISTYVWSEVGKGVPIRRV